MFGQLPDILEDVWIEERAKRIINALPEKHPFDIRCTARNAIGQMLVYPLGCMDDASRELDAITPCVPIPDARTPAGK
jgi:hypothetical protein